MATVIETSTLESRPSRRPFFSAIRWGAVIAGVVSGTASYLLLTLLGLAVGLTAIEPQSSEPVGAVPMATGIWTGISMLIAAFIGGYVAGNMSGLARSSDGMLHGFVSWAATTLLYAFIAASALGAIMGGTFSALGGVMQTAGQAAGGGAGQQLSQMMTGGAQIDAQTMKQLQEALSAGDRDRAVTLLTNNTGMSQDQATAAVDKAMPLFDRQNIRQTAAQATETVTAASWWLFIGLLLSLALGIIGGATGVRATNNRLVGDHSGERHVRTAP